jgi:subtilisin family serine protease
VRPYRLSRAPWRAAVLAAAVVAAAIPVAQAAEPSRDAKRPYVVLLDNQSADAKAVANDHSRRFGVGVKRLYDRGLRGYAGSMTEREAKALAREPGVLVAPDEPITAFAPPVSPENVSKQPLPYYSSLPTGWGWGLDRIDQHPSLSAKPEGLYNFSKTGAGVTAYIIDTGVRTSHQEFEGRATVGPNPDPLGGNGQDCNGHGTHVAGILGGRTFGVAKEAKIVSVRVLDCSGSGSTSSVVAGINWVTGEYKKQNYVNGNLVAPDLRKPAVANMSLGGSSNSALDKAVADSIAVGVTYSIAAGNGNTFGNGVDACNTSPARVTAALTVGATDNTDKKTTWSNYGSCVDVFAPGNSIVSSYGATGSTNTSWQTLSGTSMAAPAVGGVAALLLQIAPGASPAQVSQTVAFMATDRAVTNMAGAKLLYAPWGDDIGEAAKKLGEPAQSPPPPPPPRSCFILCFM